MSTLGGSIAKHGQEGFSTRLLDAANGMDGQLRQHVTNHDHEAKSNAAVRRVRSGV